MRALVRAIDARVDDLFAPLRGNRIADRVFYSASALGDFGLLWLALGLAADPARPARATHGRVCARSSRRGSSLSSSMPG